MVAHRVYVVDDDEAVRTSLEVLLAATGRLSVEGFASGEMFLAAAPHLECGCLLLDLHMPGASGLDVLRAVRAQRLPFGVIVITGNADLNSAVAAMKSGASNFIEKPFAVGELFTMIEQVCIELEEAEQQRSRELAARQKIDALSGRERDVLLKLIAGRQNKETALELGISPRTVEVYRANVMEKLGVQSVPAALRMVMDAGLLEHAA